jgi:2'-5' RNA ligase
VLSPESKVVRAFVAIKLPTEVRAALGDVQAELKEVLPRNSTAWTRPANMHLTLRFLGDVASSRLPELQLKLREALTGFGSLDLVCERLGCFPDLRFPRVVWAWVHDVEERLAQLHRRVDEAVAGFAEKPAEARFTGHVTLARPKQIKRADAERLAGFVERAVERKFGNWSGREVELIRSELSPGGSQYSTIEVFRL